MQAYLVKDEVSSENESSIKTFSLGDWTTLDKTSLAKQYPIFAVDDDKPLDTIIRGPNASDEDVDTLVKNVNGTKPSVAQKFCCGLTLVPVGHVRLVLNNGRVEVVGPGRYRLKLIHRCFAQWGKQWPLTMDSISDGSFTMVRCRRGQLGLAIENGRPVILDEGLHVYNSPLFSFLRFVPMDSEYINHMSYNVIRVPKGCFGKIWEQGVAKLLPQGLHAVDNAVFKYDGLVNSGEPHISHGSIQIVMVPKGSVGLVLESGYPKLLQEGVHIYDSPTMEFRGTKNKLTSCIQHGTITRVRIQKGEVGLAWLNNEPVLIQEPGTYEVDSASFKFERVTAVDQKNIALGSHKIVTVYAGQVGISYNGGKLQILPPGRHVIDHAEHTFDDFLSTQQRSMRLKSVSKVGRGGEDLLICETKDLVQIGIRADVFYRIADPERAITQVGNDGISDLVSETSIATLTNIMRSTTLNEIAQNSLPSAVSEKAHAEHTMTAQAIGQPSAPMFFDKAHDMFLSKLHDDFMEKFGLEISNIRIEQFKIMDEALATSISRQAVTTAETESKLANLEGQTAIATQTKERDARLATIDAETEASVRKLTAEAKVQQAEAEVKAQQVQAESDAKRKRIQAEAEAESAKIRAAATIASAEAEAKSVTIRAEASVSEAKAQAEAIREKAKAESERAQLLASTTLGEKLALLDIYGEVVKSSNQGVEKVVYVDPSTTQAGNPFGLLTLQSLNRDLTCLSTSGA